MRLPVEDVAFHAGFGLVGYSVGGLDGAGVALVVSSLLVAVGATMGDDDG